MTTTITAKGEVMLSAEILDALGPTPNFTNSRRKMNEPKSSSWN